MSDRKKMKIALFNVYGHHNSGDAMLMLALLSMLKKTFPNATIEGIAFDPISERKWMPEIVWHERICNAVSKTIFGRIRQSITLVLALFATKLNIVHKLSSILPELQHTAIQCLQSCDLAISVPGGYLEDSNSSYILNLLQMRIARALCPYVLLAPQSIGPVRSKLGRRLLRKTLLSMDRIFVREHSSYAFVAELFGERNKAALEAVSSSGDLAFWFEGDEPSEIEIAASLQRLDAGPPHKILGCTLVNWNFPHLANAEAARNNYIEAFCILVDHAAQNYGYKVVIFNQVDGDLPISRRLKQLRPSVIVDDEERSTALLAKLIGKSDIFIGTRFHSCVFALNSGVPTCVISYLPKSDGIMHDLGLSEHVIDINKVTGKDLIAHLDYLATDRAGQSKRFEAAVERYRREHNRFISFLDQLRDERFNHHQ